MDILVGFSANLMLCFHETDCISKTINSTGHILIQWLFSCRSLSSIWCGNRNPLHTEKWNVVKWTLWGEQLHYNITLNSTDCAVTLVYCAVECIKMIFLEIVATVQFLTLPQFYRNYSLCADTNIGQSQAIVYYKLSVELWFQRFHAQFEWTGKKWRN